MVKKASFHHFFFMITIDNAMTNTRNRDFVFIFSGKGLISNPIMVDCLEFTRPTMKFHLLSAAHIPGRLARCHMGIVGIGMVFPLNVFLDDILNRRLHWQYMGI